MRKRAWRPPRPYDPFEFTDRPAKRCVCSWATVEEEDLPFALQALAQFRRANPDYGKIPPDQLDWGYAWTEAPVLLSMSLPAKERADARARACQTMVVSCGKEEALGYSHDLPSVSTTILCAILAEEEARLAIVDTGGSMDMPHG